MRVRWTRVALDDVAGITAYIRVDRPRAARAVRGKIHEYVGLISEHPELGRNGRVAGTREIVLAGLPFVIVYRLAGAELQVLRLLHTSMQYP